MTETNVENTLLSDILIICGGCNSALEISEMRVADGEKVHIVVPLCDCTFDAEWAELDNYLDDFDFDAIDDIDDLLGE